MRVVFMGTPDFAVVSLKCLVDEKVNVVGVITAPDKPAGRGYKMQSSAVKQYAESVNLPILQPTNLKDHSFIEDLAAWKADLQVVVAFRMLPEVVWNMPQKGTINLHGSLLPQYRGAAPINWAVINGEKESGVSTFFIRQKIDTGAVIDQRKVSIGENDTAGDLHDNLMHVGAQLLLETVQAIEKDGVEAVEQESMAVDGGMKPAPKIHRDTCQIDWTKSAQEVHNFVRGLSPFPGAWTTIAFDDKSKSLKLFDTRVIIEGKSKPGTITTDNKTELTIACGSGAIKILKLQIEGKRRMETGELLRGMSFEGGLIQ